MQKQGHRLGCRDITNVLAVKSFLPLLQVTASQIRPKERTLIHKCLILHFLSTSIPTGVERKPGGRPSFFPHPVAVHDDFPAVSLERMHPVLCPHVGGVSLGLLGPQREPDGESHSLENVLSINFHTFSEFNSVLQS